MLSLSACLASGVLAAVLGVRLPLYGPHPAAEVVGWGAVTTAGPLEGDELEGRAGLRGTAVSTSANVTESRSVSLWVRAEGNATLLSITTDNGGWSLALDSEGAVEVYIQGTLAAVAATRAVSTFWHHIAVVQSHHTVTSADFLRVFIDGSDAPLNYTVSTSLSSTTASHSISANPDQNSRITLSDVRIYNGLLCAAEVQHLAAGLLPNPPSDLRLRGEATASRQGPGAFVGCFLFEDTVESVSVPTSSWETAASTRRYSNIVESGRHRGLYSAEDEQREQALGAWVSAFNSESSGSLDGCSAACSGFSHFGLMRSAPGGDGSRNTTECLCRNSPPLASAAPPGGDGPPCGEPPLGPNANMVHPALSGTEGHIAVYLQRSQLRQQQVPALALCNAGPDESPLEDPRPQGGSVPSASGWSGPTGGGTTHTTPWHGKYPADLSQASQVRPDGGDVARLTGTTAPMAPTLATRAELWEAFRLNGASSSSSSGDGSTSHRRFGCAFPGLSPGVNVTENTIRYETAFIPGTLSLWVLPRHPLSGDAVLLRWGSRFSLRLASFRLRAGYDGSENFGETLFQLKAGVWYYIRLTFTHGVHSMGGFQIFVDGVKAAEFISEEYIPLRSFDTLRVGSDGETIPSAFTGVIYDVKMFRAANVADPNIPDSQPSSLVREWCADGSSFQDASIYRGDGVPDGGATISSDRPGGRGTAALPGGNPTQPPPKSYCNLGGGSVAVGGAYTLNYPFSVAAFVRFPRGCGAPGNTTQAALGALLGWRDLSRNGSTADHPHIALYRTSGGDVFSGAWVPYANARWTQTSCGDPKWRHLAVTVSPDRHFNVFFDGILTYRRRVPADLMPEGLPFSPLEARIGGRYDRGQWHGNSIHIKDLQVHRGVLFTPEEVTGIAQRAVRGGGGGGRATPLAEVLSHRVSNIVGHYCATRPSSDRGLDSEGEPGIEEDFSGIFGKPPEHIGSGVTRGLHGGCEFDGSGESCMTLPNLGVRPMGFTFSAWVRIDKGSPAAGEACSRFDKEFATGSDTSTSTLRSNIKHGYSLNIGEDFADLGALLSLRGAWGSDSQGMPYQAEATLGISRHFYPVFRERDASGRSRISAPQGRGVQNLCAGQDWTHIAVTFSHQNDMAMYINGNRVNLVTIRPEFNAFSSEVTEGGARFIPEVSRGGVLFGETTLGCVKPDAGVSSAAFQGEMHDVMLLSAILTPAEVNAAARSTKVFGESRRRSSGGETSQLHQDAIAAPRGAGSRDGVRSLWPLSPKPTPASASLLLKTCHGSTGDVSGWGRQLSISEEGTAFSTEFDPWFLNQEVCSMKGIARLHVEESQGNDLFDRPAGITVLMWARRNTDEESDAIGCQAEGGAAYFTMAKSDSTVLEYRGEGFSPRLFEGSSPRSARAVKSASFTPCGEARCTNTTGWRSPAYPMDECMLWAPPCSAANQTQTYAKISLVGPEGSASAEGVSVEITLFEENTCNHSSIFDSKRLRCGECHEGLSVNFSVVNEMGCASALLQADMEMRFTKGSPAAYGASQSAVSDKTYSMCDTEWHHHAVVIPANRVQARLFYDLLPTQVPQANGSTPLDLPDSFVEHISFGLPFDNVFNGSFTKGPVYSDFADISVYGSALSYEEILEEVSAGLLWVERVGRCDQGFYEMEGVSLQECRRRCLASANCRAVQFPLSAAHSEGCRVHNDEGNFPSCSFAPGTANTTVHFPTPALQQGGLTSRFCAELLPAAGVFRSYDTLNYSVTRPVDHSLPHSDPGFGLCDFGTAGAIPEYFAVSFHDTALQQRPFEFTVVAEVMLGRPCGTQASGASTPGANGNDMFLVEWSDAASRRQSVGFDAYGNLFYSSGRGEGSTAMVRTTAAYPLCSIAGRTVWRSVAATLSRSGVLTLYIDNTMVAHSAGIHPWSRGGERVAFGGSIHQTSSGLAGYAHNIRVYNRHHVAASSSTGDPNHAGRAGQALEEIAPPLRRSILAVCGGVAGETPGWRNAWNVSSSDPLTDAGGAGRHPSYSYGVEGAAAGVGGGVLCSFPANRTAGGGALRWYPGRGAPLRGAGVELSAFVLIPNCSGTHPIAAWEGSATRGSVLYARAGVLAYTEKHELLADPIHVVSSPGASVCSDGMWHHIALRISPSYEASLHVDGNDTTLYSQGASPPPPFLDPGSTAARSSSFRNFEGRGDGGATRLPHDPGLNSNAPLGSDFSVASAGFFGLDSSPWGSAGCPGNWTKCGSKCYHVNTNVSSFDESLETCRGYGLLHGFEEASLGVARSAEEHACAKEALLLAGSPTSEVFQGITSDRGYLAYTGPSSEAADERRDVDYIPSGSSLGFDSTSHCGAMSASSGAFSSVRCAAERASLCQMQRRSYFRGQISGLRLRYLAPGEAHGDAPLPYPPQRGARRGGGAKVGLGESQVAEVARALGVLNSGLVGNPEGGVGVTSPTATASIPGQRGALCDVVSVRGSRASLAAPDGSTHTNVIPIVADSGSFVLWVTGKNLRGCSLHVPRSTVYSAPSSFTYLQLPLLVATSTAGGGHLATVSVSESAASRLAYNEIIPVYVKHDWDPSPGSSQNPEGYVRGTNFSLLYTTAVPPKLVKGMGAEGTLVQFRDMINLDKFPDAVAGLSSITGGGGVAATTSPLASAEAEPPLPTASQRCGSIIQSHPIGKPHRRSSQGVLFSPVEGPGGEFALCVKLSPGAGYFSEAFPDGNATVHVAGRCYGNGVWLHGRGECSCHRNEMQGFWSDSSSCRHCAPGFFGERCATACSPQHCSFRGTCTPLGDCLCELGFVGARCEEPLPCSLIHKAVKTPELGGAGSDGGGTPPRRPLAAYPLSSGVSDSDGLNPLEVYNNVSVHTDGFSHFDNTQSGKEAFSAGGVSYVATPEGALNLTSGSVSLWFRALHRSNYSGIPLLCIGAASFTSGAGGGAQSFYSTSDACVVVDDVLYTSVQGEERRGTTHTDTLDDARWHHLALSFGSPVGATLYLDGREEVSSALAGNLTNSTVFGARLYLGGHTVDMKDVVVTRDAFSAADALSLYSVGIVDRDGLPCPGVCTADTLLAVFSFSPSSLLLDTDPVNGKRRTRYLDADGMLKAELYDGNGAANITAVRESDRAFVSDMDAVGGGTSASARVTHHALRLTGLGCLNTRVVFPEDEWTISAWFRSTAYSPGCLFASVYGTASPGHGFDAVSDLVAGGSLEAGGFRVSSDLCITNRTDGVAGHAVASTVFSHIQDRVAMHKAGWLSDGQWHHMVQAHTFEGQAVYLDGVQVARSKPARHMHPRSTVWVGWGHVAATAQDAAYFSGDVSDLRIYAKGLSRREVGRLYSALRYAPDEVRGTVPKGPTAMKLGKGWIPVRKFPK